MKFLAKQGLPLRGDGTEDNSNFMQTLLLRAEDNAQIHEWLRRKNETYSTKNMLNKMLKLIAQSCLSTKGNKGAARC